MTPVEVTVATVVVVGLTFIVGLHLVLKAVLRTRPELFKFKATVSSWASVELEMRKPGVKAEDSALTSPSSK